jgi:hypothetical protein
MSPLPYERFCFVIMPFNTKQIVDENGTSATSIASNGAICRGAISRVSRRPPNVDAATPSATAPTPAWGASSAALASILTQDPVRIAMHAETMLSPQAKQLPS